MIWPKNEVKYLIVNFASYPRKQCIYTEFNTNHKNKLANKAFA